MPSLVLDNKIPHSILFPCDPLRPLPLKVFGSTCFVHNFSSDLDKLSPRSHKCVFLGFTRSHKGYKCFSPSLNCYFVSADITFNEYSFYFKSHSPSYKYSSNTINIPNNVNICVLCDPVSVSCPSSISSPPPLQVYNHHQVTHLKCQLLFPLQLHQLSLTF